MPILSQFIILFCTQEHRETMSEQNDDYSKGMRSRIKPPKSRGVYFFSFPQGYVRYFFVFSLLLIPVFSHATLSELQLSAIEEIELAMKTHLSSSLPVLSPESKIKNKQGIVGIGGIGKKTLKNSIKNPEKAIKKDTVKVSKEGKKPIKKGVTKKKKSKKALTVNYCLGGSYDKLALRAKKYQKIISKYSQKYDVSESLIKAIITAESCFNNKAESPKGAQGLMQLMPATAKRFGTNDSFDSDQNIKAGTRYLKFLLAYYEEDFLNAIAAYNAGEGAVDKYKGIPPYNETRVYVSKVASLYKLFTQGGGKLTSGSVASTHNKQLQESIFVPRAMPRSRFSPYKGRAKNISHGQCANRTSTRLKKSTQVEGGNGIWQRIYTARRGDTLTRVMQRTGIHKSKIAQMNGLRSRAKLKEGQRILVWECRK